MSEAKNGGNVMERLTIPDVRVDEHTTRRTMIDVEAVREHAMDFYWRLKAYEDTELTPEKIERSKLEIEAGCVKAIARTYGIDINRLRKLAEADRAGRLAVLPCKTQQEELLEQYPTADVDKNGILEVCPALLFASHRGKKGGCSTPNRSCDDCRKEFWGSWTEAALEAMKDANG